MKRWLQRIACRLFHPRETRSNWSSATVGIPGGTMTDEVRTVPRTFCPKCDPHPPFDLASARIDLLRTTGPTMMLFTRRNPPCF